ncbi:Hpt domain-containing protein [Allochromatium vinosum]|uniref:Hpt domain-containing protein n=1 Tax=Allochromatium vinosum TaxID=1049 RepID=UPI00068168A7|nr:Hpt domain-containing protein [Allochromatium vinosum]
MIRRLTGRAVEIPEDRHTPDPAAGSVQIHSSDSELEFPGLDVERALTVWKDADVYGQYLRHFVDSYGEVSRRLVTAEPESARQLAHKLRGAAGNLGLVDVAARAAELEQALKSAGTGTTPEIDSQVVALQGALATALASIERFATVPSSVPTGLRHHIGSRANPGR